MILQEGSQKIIHVNQQIIAENNKNDTDRPAIEIKHGGQIYLAHYANINGSSKIIHNQKNALSGGVKVYIETTAEVEFE